MIVLRKLLPRDEDAFKRALAEFQEEGIFEFIAQMETGIRFGDLIELLKHQEKGINLPQGFVPSTYLFAFLQEKLVGRVMIRHHLNDFLRRIGGHIGYGVVASERGKGFGKEMFKQSLPIAQSIGLQRVLITCDEDNVASRKIIESAPAYFEGLSPQGKDLPDKRLYWVDL